MFYSAPSRRTSTAMGFVQSIDTAREATISRAGVASPYTQALGRTREALDALRAGYTDGSLRLLRIAAERNDLVVINDAARRISAGATDILILGTGGSSLGGQTLAQLAGYAVPGLGTLRERPRLHFIDNLDPHTYGLLLAKLPLASTRFIAISKSGSTGETLMQTMTALAAVRDAGLSARIPELFLGLTEPLRSDKRSGLRVLFEQYGI